MLLYTFRRLLGFIPMLILLAFLTFSLSFYGPGDPLRVIMGENWTNEEVVSNTPPSIWARPAAVRPIRRLFLESAAR